MYPILHHKKNWGSYSNGKASMEVQQGDHALLLVGQLQMAVVPEPGVVQRPTIHQIKALFELFHSRKLGVCQGSGLGSGSFKLILTFKIEL